MKINCTQKAEAAFGCSFLYLKGLYERNSSKERFYYSIKYKEIAKALEACNKNGERIILSIILSILYLE